MSLKEKGVGLVGLVFGYHRCILFYIGFVCLFTLFCTYLPDYFLLLAFSEVKWYPGSEDLTDNGAVSGGTEVVMDGTLKGKAKGSVVDKPKGSVVENANGSAAAKPKGSVVENANGSVAAKPKGGVVENPKGCLAPKPKGAVTAKPKGSVVEKPKVCVAAKPNGAVAAKPKGSVVEKPKDSGVAKPGEPRNPVGGIGSKRAHDNAGTPMPKRDRPAEALGKQVVLPRPTPVCTTGAPTGSFSIFFDRRGCGLGIAADSNQNMRCAPAGSGATNGYN